MGIKLLDGDGLQYIFSKIKSALANKQDKLTLPLSVANGGTGNNSGTSSSATTTEDTTNTLYVVGVTSNATTTLKRDTSVTVKGNTITGNLVGSVTGNVSGSSGSTTGNAATATKLKDGRALKVSLASNDNSTAFDGSADVTNIGVSGTLKIVNGGTGATDLANVTVGAATKATKLSNTSKIGDTDKPVYFGSDGKPTAISSTVGGVKTPVYLSSGTITACSDTVGSATNPVYFSGGTVTACTYSLGATVNEGTSTKLAYYSGAKAISSYSSTVGSYQNPCYISNGVPTAALSITYGTLANRPASANRGDIYIVV